MAEILVVEDDKLINQLVCKNLSLVGHHMISAEDGLKGLDYLNSMPIDLVILDVNLPFLSGFDLMERIKDTPVIFLTAKDSLEDKLEGLKKGAQDYIVKPFEMLELVARVDVVLRRYSKNEQVFQIRDVKVNFDKRTVEVGGVPCELTHQEFMLLEVLVHNINIALSREKLLELAWGFDFEGDTRTVDVHIQRLRKKLNLENEIKTVYKTGYRLDYHGRGHIV